MKSLRRILVLGAGWDPFGRIELFTESSLNSAPIWVNAQAGGKRAVGSG
jgi:hypothetical protein